MSLGPNVLEEAWDVIEEAEAIMRLGLQIAGSGGRRIGGHIVVQTPSARAFLKKVEAWKERQGARPTD